MKRLIMPWCLAAEGFRACTVKHAIESGAADDAFDLPTRPRPAPKRRAMMDFYRPIAVSISERLS
ncbi:hypothetical protein AS890_21230 [Rhizobium anhuiense bv. trifolii]|nr:hypothetical protein AS890_21230 [Rhizobium anhuiense bv. trifolii]